MEKGYERLEPYRPSLIPVSVWNHESLQSWMTFKGNWMQGIGYNLNETSGALTLLCMLRGDFVLGSHRWDKIQHLYMERRKSPFRYSKHWVVWSWYELSKDWF